MTGFQFNQKTQRITDLIVNGGVGVIPTDTLYGVVAQAKNQEAVNRLYDLKSRHKKPGTIIAANIEQLVELGITRRYLKAVEGYWPGKVSVVIPVSGELAGLTQGLPGLAVRVVDDPELVRLLEVTGALMTSSANEPGKTPAINIEQAKSYFGDSVDFYIDGGDFSERKPSTVLRIIDDEVDVLRVGAVSID